VSVENKIEKLNSHTTELREMALAQNNNGTLPRTLNSVNENIINSNNVEVQTTICFLLRTVGNVSGAISTNSSLGTISNKPQIACSGLGNPEFSLSLFGDN
jgi:hypothetical protein